MNAELTERVGVWFSVDAVRPDGSVREICPPFHNLVLDVGLDALYDTSLNQLTGTVHVGDSSQTPATTDTGLISEVANTSTTDQASSGGSTSPLYSSRTRRFVFAEGAAQGNLTEVGLSDGAASPTFFNRQLFRDGNGDPVTVTILADEQLRITAEARIESDIQTDESTTNNFTFDGSTITATRTVSRTLYWTDTGGNNFTYWKFSNKNFFELDDIPADSVTVSSYTAGSFEATFTLVWNAGTLDGSYSTLVYGGDVDFYQFDFSTALAVASTEELTLTVKRTWGRA